MPDSQLLSVVPSVQAAACLCRHVWHRGRFCQIRHPGRRCDVKGAVKRQPPGSTGTAALSALFSSVAQTNTPADVLRWEKKKPPRMVQSLQNKRYHLLGDQETVTSAVGLAWTTCLWRRDLYQLGVFVYNKQHVGGWENVFRL